MFGEERKKDHEKACHGHGKFGVHSQNFEDLINEKVFKTEYDVISVIVTNNRARIVAVLKKNEQVSCVQQYCLKQLDIRFEEYFGTESDDIYSTFLKFRTVE